MVILVSQRFSEISSLSQDISWSSKVLLGQGEMAGKMEDQQTLSTIGNP
jgi:hypothetical protein